MNRDETILKYSLLACVIYFVCMAIAHWFGIKLPILFVYYDTPFYAYQDRIISFAVVTYILLFYAAYQHKNVVPYAILSLLTTFLGLSGINLTEPLRSVLGNGGTLAYWLQTLMIGGICLWITVFYFRTQRSS